MLLLLVLAVVRDHGAGVGVGEGVVLLVRSIGETDTEEQQKDEFGSRVLVIKHHVRDGASNLVEKCDQIWIELDHQKVFFKIPFCNNKVLI